MNSSPMARALWLVGTGGSHPAHVSTTGDDLALDRQREPRGGDAPCLRHVPTDDQDAALGNVLRAALERRSALELQLDRRGITGARGAASLRLRGVTRCRRTELGSRRRAEEVRARARSRQDIVERPPEVDRRLNAVFHLSRYGLFD